MDRITFADCCNDLSNRAPAASKALTDWQARPGYGQVVSFVQNFAHEFLFTICPGDVQDAMQESSHPLGDIESTEQLRYIENFTTPFAFQHLFHWYLEQNKTIPTWNQFRDWMVTGPASSYWYVPLKRFLETNYPNADRQDWSRAARWRLGKVYLSNMRELDLLARLRDIGIPARYHVLADVLFRVDLWAGDVLVCTYFPNSAYREGTEGRKPPAEQFFADAVPPFRIVHVPIVRQGFGQFWLATGDSIDQLAASIKPHLNRDQMQ